MHASDASLRPAALAIPAAYLSLATASVALGHFNSLPLGQDLDQLSGELIAVVDKTTKPAHASLWLRR